MTSLSNLIISGQYESLNEKDQEMLKEVSKVLEIFKNHKDEIWHGIYDINDIPLILTPAKEDNSIWHTHSYAINCEDFDGSFFTKRIEGINGLDHVYRLSMFYLLFTYKLRKK